MNTQGQGKPLICSDLLKLCLILFVPVLKTYVQDGDMLLDGLRMSVSFKQALVSQHLMASRCP